MKKTIIFGLFSLGFVACMQHEADLSGYNCSSTIPTYTADIQPIMTTHCVSCHNTNNPTDDLDLSTYAGVKEHAQHARFWGSLEHKSKYEAMPKNAAKLPDSLLTKIACWAKNGSPQ